MTSDEDMITFEVIEDEDELEPVIGIARIGNKGYAIESSLTEPMEVAKILTALAHDIIMKEAHGSDNRAYRFSRR